MGNFSRLINSNQADEYINSLYSIKNSLCVNYNNYVLVNFSGTAYDNWSDIANCIVNNNVNYYTPNNRFIYPFVSSLDNNNWVSLARTGNLVPNRNINVSTTGLYQLADGYYTAGKVECQHIGDSILIDTDRGLYGVNNWVAGSNNSIHFHSYTITSDSDMPNIDFNGYTCFDSFINNCEVSGCNFTFLDDFIIYVYRSNIHNTNIVFGNNGNFQISSSNFVGNIYFGDNTNYRLRSRAAYVSGNLYFGNNCNISMFYDEDGYGIMRNNLYLNVEVSNFVNMCYFAKTANQYRNKYYLSVNVGYNCNLYEAFNFNTRYGVELSNVTIGNNCNLAYMMYSPNHKYTLTDANIVIGYNCNLYRSFCGEAFSNTKIWLPTGAYSSSSYSAWSPEAKDCIRWY